MKYAKDTRAQGIVHEAADVLVEALPWIKNITGKTVVIKYGGSAMVNKELRSAVMSDIVLLKIIGINPVIVHGGGQYITDAMERFGVPVEFKDGLRVTSDEAMEIVKMVLMGQVNQELVEALNQHGNFAVGVSGSDAGTIFAEQLSPDLGRVGKISQVSSVYLEDLIMDDYVPVVASIAMGEEGGYYNVNADMVAGDVASAIGAHKIIFLTDVDGLYEDFNDKNSLISNLSLNEIKRLFSSNTVDTGMIPKLKACMAALEAGVFRAHIINGTVPHALLLELLTDSGVGTTMHSTDEACEFDAHPLGNFASKLIENTERTSLDLDDLEIEGA
jgi:acetylglutamate kinase